MREILVHFYKNNAAQPNIGQEEKIAISGIILRFWKICPQNIHLCSEASVFSAAADTPDKSAGSTRKNTKKGGVLWNHEGQNKFCVIQRVARVFPDGPQRAARGLMPK
jgi:hypothetical protein